MNNSDLNLLRLMLEAARDAQSFVAGETRRSLDADKKLLFALTRSIETIGNIAERVPAGVRAECPDLPWAELTELSASFTRVYFGIDADMLWQTATREVPQVASALERAIAASSTE
ncbi:MAG TPA: HepT-like ribonuclease domain-containing protein [Pyrinomonadaceae bacterium]|jgi:uncharacterized protein with HEPN domain